VTRNTYESQMVERANKKLGLERALNADRANDGLPGAAGGAAGGARGGAPTDKAEIDLMLKQGAHDIFMDEQVRALCVRARVRACVRACVLCVRLRVCAFARLRVRARSVSECECVCARESVRKHTARIHPHKLPPRPAPT
jgi:hypothetical protein